MARIKRVRDAAIHRVDWVTGRTELESAYGMEIALKVKSGAPSPAVPTIRERQAQARRESGLSSDQGTLAATKISPTVAVVTVRLPQGGYRCVAVAAGGAVLELFNKPFILPVDARRQHGLIVAKVREYLGREGIVDFSEPLLALFRPPLHGGTPARHYGSKQFCATDSPAPSTVPTA